MVQLVATVGGGIGGLSTSTGGGIVRRYSTGDPQQGGEGDEETLKPLLPTVPDNRGPPTIPLSMLIDLAVQRILHELTVLVEL